MVGLRVKRSDARNLTVNCNEFEPRDPHALAKAVMAILVEGQSPTDESDTGDIDQPNTSAA